MLRLPGNHRCTKTTAAAGFSHLAASAGWLAPAAADAVPGSLDNSTGIGEHSFAHAVQLLASLADTAALQLPPEVSSSGEAAASAATAAVKQSSGGWLGPLTDGLQQTLQYLQHGLEQLHVPYTYGWAIVLLTILVKTATLPLTKIQVDSSAMTCDISPARTWLAILSCVHALCIFDKIVAEHVPTFLSTMRLTCPGQKVCV